MKNIDYKKLNYDHKLLYIRSVFEEAKKFHPVYEKLYTLLTWTWKIEEQHLDMLYTQVESVVHNLESEEIVQKMWTLAAQLEQLKKMEELDRQREQKELEQMEKILMMIQDDKPIQLGS